jgi:dienelactone hydrolase
MSIKIWMIALAWASSAFSQPRDQERLHQHRVTFSRSPAPEAGAETHVIPSLVEGLRDKSGWPERRAEIERFWRNLLGKTAPAGEDRKYFGDITTARLAGTEEKEHYTALDIELPMEIDFWQKHLLLIPKGRGRGPFPAVICWSSSSPDYKEPEKWWGSWLAERGYVVLTSWSFIRNYRDGTTARTGAAEKVYDRFGRWLALGKMVHDAEREAEYLRRLTQVKVDENRIGFIGFSLGAKAAVYVAAFAPSISATVALDPHIAVNGGTNWLDPWYLDATRRWPDIDTPEGTVLSLLNPDRQRPGFEHDHHELLALAAPKPFLLIGGSRKEDTGGDSDDLQSWGYFNRARQVYELLGAGDRISFASTEDGHKANGPNIDPAWRQFFEKWLKGKR